MQMLSTIKNAARIHQQCISNIIKLPKRKFASVTKCDVITIGGGIAGASCSYRLARIHNLNVVCLEKEFSPGCHATGKSFGLFAESNAPCVEIKQLTTASRLFYENPDPECVDDDMDEYDDPNVLTQIGLLGIASPIDSSHLTDAFGGTKNTQIYSIDEAMKIVPFLNKNAVADHAIYEPHACNFNTRLAYEHFLIGGYNVGVKYLFNHSPMEINKSHNGNWEIACHNEETNTTDRFEAGLLINCCGQWADEIAIKAGIKPIDLITQKATVIVFTYKNKDIPHSDDNNEPQTPWLRWVSPNAGEIFHGCFHGDNGVFRYDELFGNPIDEDETEMVLQQISKYTTLNVKKVASKSAGIKCTTKYDKNMVIGPADEDASFVWCAALGSYGLQTAPAYSEITSYLALNKALPQQYIDLGIDVNKLTLSRILI